MRAVNLIPLDERRGAGAPSRSGGLVYGVLGALGVLALVVVLYSLSARSLDEQKQTLAQLTADQAAGAQAAAALEPYVRFGQIADARESTVETIAGQRFDWGLAMRELARVLPVEVDLVSLDGQRAAAAADANGATTGPGAPQVTMVGCASSQSAVALLMARLRAIRGVDRVRLESSSKGERAGAGGGGAAGSTDCRAGKDEKPQFTLAVIFRADEAPAQPAQAGAAPAAAGAAQPASASTQEGSS